MQMVGRVNGGEFMRVLVVEDDQSIRETIGIVLEAYQHQADLASNGGETIAFLERSVGNWPDVMLLDLKLSGESGEEVHERILSRFGRVPPTVVISAAQEGMQRAGRIPGARFLPKPYTIDELLNCLEEVTHPSPLSMASSA
ncbi:DNA-binding response regulator [bacterium]|nr:DNA-binding response regulator [bacterium]